MTNKQKQVIERIKANTKGWEIKKQEEWETGHVALIVEKDPDSVLLNKTCILKIGKRGKLTFFAASVFFVGRDNEKKSYEKVTASLCGYDLFGYRKFTVKFN